MKKHLHIIKFYTPYGVLISGVNYWEDGKGVFPSGFADGLTSEDNTAKFIGILYYSFLIID